MKKKSKKQRVAEYLVKHKRGITQMQAVRLFNAYRLSAIIFELKKEMDIVTLPEKTKDGTVFARYVLKDYIEED